MRLDQLRRLSRQRGFINLALRRGWFAGIPPALDLKFDGGAIDSRLTTSGGAGGTRVNSAGLIVAASAPRIDYDPVTLARKGLLVEEQWTNLLLQSSDYTQAAWMKAGSTITTGAWTAPDGSSAQKLVESTNTGGHTIQVSPTLSASTTYTSSIYAKAGDRTWLYLVLVSNTIAKYAYFDLVNGVVGNTSGITSSQMVPLGNGVYRCSITVSTESTGNNTIAYQPALANGSVSYTGVAGKGVYLWGAQLEAGSFATSYIPTTSAQVTRTADVASLSGSNFSGVWNAAQGTVGVTFDVNATTGTRPVVSFDDGTANNQIRIYTSGTSLKATVTTGGVQQADLTLGTVAAGTQYKAALSYAAGAFNAQMTGGALQTGTDTVPAVTQMRIGADQAGNYQDGHSARVRIWTRPLAAMLGSLV